MRNGKILSRALAVVLCVMMLVSVVPVTAFATIADWSENNVVYDQATFGTNGYYNVISKKDYVLVPGAATETEMVLNNAAGTRRQVIHVIEVDPSNPDVSVLPGYYNIDKLAADPSDSSAYQAAGVTNVANYYEEKLGYKVVGAMNTDLDYTDNAPRVLVYNGQILSGYTGASAPSSVLYVWNNDGEISCEVTSYKKADMEAGVASGKLLHAISVSFSMVVKDGQLVNKSENHNGGSDDAARSMVGVKEDGTLVLVMNDGRGANNSKGFSSYEEGECMLALGCKWAANCDGGGSSSFVTRRAGEEDLVCRCVPCDGAERPTKSSVIVVSNVAPTGVLDNVNVTADYDIFAPNTTYTFDANAIDTHGYAMELPAEAEWAVSDASFGTIVNGTFVSNGTLGNVDIQIKIDGVVVGEKEITIANPTTLAFTQASTVLPYGKSTTLAFNSLIGEAEVYLDGSSFAISMSNANAGTLDGLVFTATSDETIAGTVITAKYLATNTDLTYTIEFGKGSEVIWDFEDNDLHGFLGQQDAYDWQLAHGVATPFGYSGDGLNTLINKGQISTDVTSTAFIASEENGGQVHNGKYSLGYTFNMTQDAFNEWTYAVIYNISNINGDVVLRDVANGKKATKFGCWVYVPEGFRSEENAGSLALQANLFGGATKETAAQIGLNMQYNGKNLNACTEADIPENRWVYVVADISGYNYVSLVDPLQTNYRSPSVMRMYIKPSVAQVLTYYFDEFTLDYSSAVDDRVPPVISNPQYAPADTNIAFNNGVTLTEPSAGFTAYISDANSGIDASTAQIYIDGNKVITKVTGNMMFCDAVSLGVGTHKVKFEVADKLGNYTTLTRTIVSATDNRFMVYRTRIEIDGHNDSGETPMPGSVYYIDVCNNYSEGITSEFTLLLNTANEWILDQMTVVDGYNVTYTVNPANPNEVTFTCSSKNMNGSKRVMFSIPVRVYNPLITNGTSDGSAVKVSGKEFVAPLTVKLTSCTVAGSYGNYYEFSVSELAAKRKIERHEHTAVAVADKAASCTENGYTGKTYCAVCQSVADFGTKIEATGHNYVFVEGRFVCSECNAEYDYSNITGLFAVNGKSYYAIAGQLVPGWQKVEDDYYYFDAETYTTVDSLNNGKVTFEFEADGKLISGQWYYDGVGYKYYYGPDYYRAHYAVKFACYAQIDGKTYIFSHAGYRANEGYEAWYNNGAYAPTLYEFDENGAMLGIADDGIVVTNNGDIYYVIDGNAKSTGLIKIDGDYYYFSSNFKALRDCTSSVVQTNGLLPAGTYTFDENGRMVAKNGWFEANGEKYFYVNGEAVKGLQKIDGKFYFFKNSTFAMMKNQKYTVTVAYGNGLIAEATEFTFDANGVGTRFTGFKVLGGNTYYYVDDTMQKGLQFVDGKYYFFKNSTGAMMTSNTYIVATAYGNGLIDQSTTFVFDENGVGTKLEYTGLKVVGGNTYYYVEGVMQKGLQLIEGKYYFFKNSTGAMMTNNTFTVATAYGNGFITKSTVFVFDANGVGTEQKFTGFKTVGGNVYYYVDDVMQKGLQLIDGQYYFFRNSTGAMMKGTTYTVQPAYANGLFTEATRFVFNATTGIGVIG